MGRSIFTTGCHCYPNAVLSIPQYNAILKKELDISLSNLKKPSPDLNAYADQMQFRAVVANQSSNLFNVGVNRFSIGFISVFKKKEIH